MIEFAVSEYVRSKFAVHAETKQRRHMCEAVAVAANIAQKTIDKMTTEVAGGPSKLACRAGCSYCCHMRVVVTIPEIIFLYEYINSNFSGSEREALGRRIASLDERSHGLSDEEWGLSHFRCPMLVDGLCSAYPARPLECRGYNSTNVAACVRAAEDYREWDVPMDELLLAVNKSAQAGLLQGLTGAGYRPRLVELVAALRVVFDDPMAIDRWLQGENPFLDAELNPLDREQRAFLPWVPSLRSNYPGII